MWRISGISGIERILVTDGTESYLTDHSPNSTGETDTVGHFEGDARASMTDHIGGGMSSWVFGCGRQSPTSTRLAVLPSLSCPAAH